MSFDYVRTYYKVPAAFGRIVKVSGRQGIITEDMGHYIGVTFDNAKANDVRPCHPTSNIEYLGMGTPRKLTRSQKRWQEYSRVAECFESFRDWLAYKKYQKAQP